MTWTREMKYSRSNEFSNVATMDATKQMQWRSGLALLSRQMGQSVIPEHALCYWFQRDVIKACICMTLHAKKTSHLELSNLLLNMEVTKESLASFLTRIPFLREVN